MIHVLCLIATENRMWAMRQALRRVEASRPGLVAGHCWSLWELSAHPEKIPDMLDNAASCRFAVVYFHGGAQSLQGFPEVWKRLTGRMPVYFESSLPDEIAQLLPDSGLTQEDWRGINRYFSLGDEPNLAALLLYIARRYFGADCQVPEPAPPPEECRACPSFSLCLGGCPAGRTARGNRPDTLTCLMQRVLRE